MHMAKIIKIEPFENYQYVLLFENGEKRLFDVRPYIKGSWFGELKNADYFKKAYIVGNGDGIEWPNGQDIAPHELRELSYLL